MKNEKITKVEVFSAGDLCSYINELEKQKDAYKEKLKTYLQGLWGCGWEEPFNNAVEEIEGNNKSE